MEVASPTAPRPGRIQAEVDSVDGFVCRSEAIPTVEAALTSSEAAGKERKHSEWPIATTTTATANILG